MAIEPRVHYIVREYRDSDLEGLLAVWDRASKIAHPFLSHDFFVEERHNIPHLYLPKADPWVAEVRGEVAGFIALLGHEVGALFIEPKYQGCGLGTALMDKAQKIHGDLEVKVFRENQRGLGFYLNYGFTVVDHQVHGATGHDLIRLQFTATL